MYTTLHGLVLREVKYKESSKILTILTEEEGKITAEAKGVLRKGSKCAGASQCLVYSEMTLFENRGRYTLTEASVTEDFAALREDIGDYALGCYFAELTEAVSDEDSPNAALLHLGLNALYALSRRLYPAEHIKACFELRLMCLAGFAPAVERCASCGCEDIPEPRFCLMGGAVHCTRCPPPEQGKSMPLCPASLAAMRHVTHADAKRIFSFTLDASSAGRFHAAAEEYAAAQLDRPFRTLEYWKSVCKTNSYVNQVMSIGDNHGSV